MGVAGWSAALAEDDGKGGGEDGGGGRQMIAVLLLLAALVGVGWWLTGALRGTAAIQDCVMAGRSNCAPR